MQGVELAPKWLEQGVSSDLWLLFLFGLFVLEGAYLLYVVPSELLVPAALLVVGDSAGAFLSILFVACLGATIGQVGLFIAVRRIGRGWLLQTRWMPVTEGQLERFEGWFDKYGPVAVPVSNSLIFVRGTMTFPAGLSRMRLSAFVLYSATGTLIFEAAIALLYYAGIYVVF